MKTPQDTAGKAAKETIGEPRNVAVYVLENRTQIGKAIVAAGKCDFPLCKSDAEALQALGKVRILGIF